jgi:outer membrane protein TolC
MMLGVLFLLLPASVSADLSAVWTLRDLFVQVRQSHPGVRALGFKIAAAEQQIVNAQSRYFPEILGSAIYSKGFPGSSSVLLQERSVVSSPFRRDAAVGVALEQMVWDFGRTQSRVEMSRQSNRITTVGNEAELNRLNFLALEFWVKCAKSRSLEQRFTQYMHKVDLLAKEIKQFVKSGQKDQVEYLLNEALRLEILQRITVSQETTRLFEEQLGLLIQGQVRTCPVLDQQLLAELEEFAGQQDAQASTDFAPQVELAQSFFQRAHTRSLLAEQNFYPTIQASGSAGFLAQTVMGIKKTPWAFAIGVEIPLFDGFGLQSRLAAARFESQFFEQNWLSEKLTVSSKITELKGSQAIELKQVELITQQQQVVVLALQVAMQRYQKFQGPLVDLRDALVRALTKETELVEALERVFLGVAQRLAIEGNLKV